MEPIYITDVAVVVNEIHVERSRTNSSFLLGEDFLHYARIGQTNDVHLAQFVAS